MEVAILHRMEFWCRLIRVQCTRTSAIPSQKSSTSWSISSGNHRLSLGFVDIVFITSLRTCRFHNGLQLLKIVTLVVSLLRIAPGSNKISCSSHGFNPPFLLPFFEISSAALVCGFSRTKSTTIFMLIQMQRHGHFVQSCINSLLKVVLFLIIWLRFRILLILLLLLVIQFLFANMLTLLLKNVYQKTMSPLFRTSIIDLNLSLLMKSKLFFSVMRLRLTNSGRRQWFRLMLLPHPLCLLWLIHLMLILEVSESESESV